MHMSSGLKPITLSPRNVLFVGVVLLLVLPIVLGIAFFDSLYAVYLSRFVAPGLESALGFKGGHAIVRWQDQSYESYVLASVNPNGTFGRAGVHSGDVPCRVVHGGESGFLGRLHHSRGERIELTFCTPPAWSEKRVTIVVPRGDGELRVAAGAARCVLAMQVVSSSRRGPRG
jgi:hypothetical protein